MDRIRARGSLGLVSVLLWLSVGCQRPAIDLEAARALEGDWLLVLRWPSGTPGRDSLPVEVRGTVALLPNRSAVSMEDFPGRPLDVGVHDLRLGAIAPGLRPQDVRVGGTIRGDSILVILGPGSLVPVRLAGRYAPDSITGRWAAYQRAGPSPSGTFVMKRR